MKSLVLRKQLAALLGIKTSTLAAWDRRHKGPGGRGVFYLNSVTAAYEREDVERFLESIGVAAPAFVSPQERGAVRWPDAPRLDEQGTGPRRRPAGSSFSEAPTTPTTAAHEDGREERGS